jgi:hypothetical protein
MICFPFARLALGVGDYFCKGRSHGGARNAHNHR